MFAKMMKHIITERIFFNKAPPSKVKERILSAALLLHILFLLRSVHDADFVAVFVDGFVLNRCPLTAAVNISEARHIDLTACIGTAALRLCAIRGYGCLSLIIGRRRFGIALVLRHIFSIMIVLGSGLYLWWVRRRAPRAALRDEVAA